MGSEAEWQLIADRAPKADVLLPAPFRTLNRADFGVTLWARRLHRASVRTERHRCHAICDVLLRIPLHFSALASIGVLADVTEGSGA